MAGLLGSTAISTGATVQNPSGAPQATAAQIGATEKWNNTADQTVAGQINTITAQDSPMMQQARTTSQQNMNKRGLLNTSIADTAAQSAVLGAAMPIAQADAAQASKVAGYNADTSNQANTFNVQQANAMASQNLNASAASSAADKAQQYAKENMGLQQQYTQANMGLQQQQNLETIGTNQANTQANMQLQQQQNLQTLGAQFGFDVGRMDAQAKNTLAQMTAQQQNDIAKLATQQGYNLETLGAQQVNELARLAAQIQGQKDVAAQQATAAEKVASIEAQYKDLTQGSASATTIVNKLQDAINAINLDTKMTPDAKTAAIQDARTNASEALNIIGALAGDVALGDFITKIGV